MIAYKFCLLVENELGDLSKGALNLIQQLTLHHVSVKKCVSYQKKLQNELPKEGFSHFSPLIWALQPNTNSYPSQIDEYDHENPKKFLMHSSID